MKNFSRLDLIRTLSHDLQIEIVENEFRENWTQSEKADIAKILKKQLQKQKTPGKRTDLVQSTSDKHLSEVPENRINKQIGKVFGESYETIRKREKVFENIDEHTRKSLDTGKRSLNSVYQNMASKEPNISKVIIPKGQWNVLEIDFPWGYQNQSIGHTGTAGAQMKYPTIPPREILDAEVPKFQKIIAKDAVLFMWVTVPLLSEIIQLQILEKLGFSYKTMISWHKLIPKKIFGGKGLGYWFEGEMEHCMVGIRGNIRPFRCTLPNFIEAPISKHSEKPQAFKELFEKATQNIPNRKFFEGYSRRYRKDWSAFGNQLESPIKTK